MLGEARRQKNRSVNGANHFVRRDLARFPGQLVAAVGPVLGAQKSALHQLLQDLREQRRRNSIGLGDLLRAGAGRRIHRQVLQCDEPVIGFFSELQHSVSRSSTGTVQHHYLQLYYNRQVEYFQEDRCLRAGSILHSLSCRLSVAGFSFLPDHKSRRCHPQSTFLSLYRSTTMRTMWRPASRRSSANGTRMAPASSSWSTITPPTGRRKS